MGGRHDRLLGPYKTPESRAEYRRILAEWESSRHPAFAGWTAPGRSPEGFGKRGSSLTKATWQRHRAKEGWPTMQSAIVERAQ
jgi:hypothetical protein